MRDNNLDICDKIDKKNSPNAPAVSSLCHFRFLPAVRGNSLSESQIGIQFEF